GRAAVALPVPGRPEDLLAEEAVLFRFESPVVNGRGLLHLAVRPLADVVGRGEADAEFVEEVDVQHVGSSPLVESSADFTAALPGWVGRRPAVSALRAGGEAVRARRRRPTTSRPWSDWRAGRGRHA